MKSFKRTAVALGDLLMPRECPVCGQRLGMNEEFLCLNCAADLPLTYFWERTHNPMADRLNAALLDQEGMPYAFAAALMFYDEDVPYKMIPRKLKYEYGLGLGRHFARMLGRYLAGSEVFRNVDTVIPVPLHWMRRFRRGYNQAAVIAKAVAGEMGAAFRDDILRRTRRTATQTRLGGEDRARNVTAAFSVRKGKVPGAPEAVSGEKESVGQMKHVLLVDDVFTTGATTAECFRTLRASLPAEVRISVATLAFVKD